MNDFVRNILNKADKFDLMQKHDEAIKLYDKLIESNYTEARIFALRGYSKFRDKRYKEAIDDFSKAIDKKNNVPTTFFYRARAREESGDIRGALEDYKKSSEFDYGKPDVHINMGMIYEYLGNLQRAENEYLIVISIDPKNKIAIESLREIRKKLENGQGNVKVK